jgi:hypothetical protein
MLSVKTVFVEGGGGGSGANSILWNETYNPERPVVRLNPTEKIVNTGEWFTATQCEVPQITAITDKITANPLYKIVVGYLPVDIQTTFYGGE